MFQCESLFRIINDFRLGEAHSKRMVLLSQLPTTFKTSRSFDLGVFYCIKTCIAEVLSFRFDHPQLEKNKQQYLYYHKSNSETDSSRGKFSKGHYAGLGSHCYRNPTTPYIRYPSVFSWCQLLKYPQTTVISNTAYLGGVCV